VTTNGIDSLLSSIPSAFPDGPDGPEIRVISGKSHGQESPVRPLGGCWYFHVKFKKLGRVFQALRKHHLSLSPDL
jgi:redox-sensitive bicupin YhaK (pirin superfamily)